MRGGYACVGLIANYGLFAFRDPHGIRPLVIGERDIEAGKEYIVASENVAFDVLGFKVLRDAVPSEGVFITRQVSYTLQVLSHQP